jgi:hypothetical protein
MEIRMKFKFKKPPEKPQRKKTKKEIEIAKFYNLKQVIEYFEDRKILYDDVKVSDYWKTFMYYMPEPEADYQKRLDNYLVLVEEYKKWQVEFKEDIKKHQEQQILKQQALVEKKAKKIKAQIEAAEEKLKELTIRKIVGI